MKVLFILLIFHGPGAPAVIQQEMSMRECQNAKTVMISDAPHRGPALGPVYKGYCFPL